jgi:hypothetical protein
LEARRFMVPLTVPRTLLEDEEAFQFFCRGMWEEMLRTAGGTPAEDPMVRGIPEPDSWTFAEGYSSMVNVRIIGYAIPAMPAEDVLRSAGFSPQLSRYVSVPEPELHLEAPPAFELSDLIRHVTDLIGQDVTIRYDTTRINDDDDYRYRPPTSDDFITHPQDDESWSDAATWVPGMADE